MFCFPFYVFDIFDDSFSFALFNASLTTAKRMRMGIHAVRICRLPIDSSVTIITQIFSLGAFCSGKFIACELREFTNNQQTLLHLFLFMTHSVRLHHRGKMCTRRPNHMHKHEYGITCKTNYNAANASIAVENAWY